MNGRLQALGDTCACVALVVCSVVGYMVVIQHLIRIVGSMATMPLR